MRRYIIHIVLFILTVASTLIVGGPAYSFTIILILLGHEMGHYLMSRRYGIRATLPFFLPSPSPSFRNIGCCHPHGEHRSLLGRPFSIPVWQDLLPALFLVFLPL